MMSAKETLSATVINVNKEHATTGDKKRDWQKFYHRKNNSEVDQKY